MNKFHTKISNSNFFPNYGTSYTILHNDCIMTMTQYITLLYVLTVFLLYTSAPFDNNNSTTGKWPPSDALYKGILPNYRIAGFCREDFNVASHGIRNIKIRYIFYLVTFYHMRFCNSLVLCL